MTDLLRRANGRLSADQIWVKPDCGLQTRKWDEMKPALTNMGEAAKQIRTARD